MSWLGVLRLALVQMALGAIVVLTTSTLNRVMAVELLLRPGACATLGVSRRAGWGLAILSGAAAAAIQLAIWNPGWRLPEGALARLAEAR